MSLDYGSRVSRTLSAEQRNFAGVIWAKKLPPLDSELNLMYQVEAEKIRQEIHAKMHSGFIMDPANALDDYVFNSLWTNRFQLGRQKTGELDPTVWANINGWVFPVAGTAVSVATDIINYIRLYPPPASGSRVDLVFLEVWQTLIKANPSTVNKPSASTLWKYGNVLYGSNNITDDLQDNEIGAMTTERIQIQYRIRVFGQGAGLGSGVALNVYPDGLGDPNILGQGAATSPVAGLAFSNMGNTLGDPALWRAGDGDPNNSLGTVDGYVYAVPISAVFRRNTQVFSAITSSGNPNQNGAFDRTPTTKTLADPLDGAKSLTQMTLVSAITASQTGVIQVNNLTGSGFDDANHNFAGLFAIIDQEVVAISAVDTGASPATITIPASLGRGRNKTQASAHAAGASISFYTHRPDGYFADQITSSDILDLRRSINPGQWDHEKLLLNALSQLLRNDLHTAWKKSSPGDTEGHAVVEVGTLFADGNTAVPNHTEALDGPDGIRTVWSDAAVIQPDVTVLCDNDAVLSNGQTSSTFDVNAAWDIAAGFLPSGFVNNQGSSGSFTNGSTIFLHIGGADGNSGARATARNAATRAVRFLSPREFWKGQETDKTLGNQHPFRLRFLKERCMAPDAPGESAPTKHPGDMYPVQELNFEYPFIVLGGILNPNLLQISGLTPSTKMFNTSIPNRIFEIDTGLNFESANAWYKKDSNGLFLNDPTQVTNKLLRDQRTLFGMLTNNGLDRTGNSSEIYVVVYGDHTGTVTNNGVFRVVGAGTSVADLTNQPATTSTRIRVVPLDPNFKQFDTASVSPFTIEFRSQHMNVEDGQGKTAGKAAISITFTDLEGIISKQAKARVQAISVQVGDTLTIGATVLTAVANGAPAVDSFESDSGDDALTASKLVTAINQYVSGVTAVLTGADVVTVTSDSLGTLGNGTVFTSSNQARLKTTHTTLVGGVNHDKVVAHPWTRDKLADPENIGGTSDFKIGSALNDKLLINSTLLYHPGRGATPRIASEMLRCSIVTPGSEYLRQSNGTLDSSFVTQAGIPTDESWFDVGNHIQFWNRLNSLGHFSPDGPGYGGQVVGFTEQDREAELFIDEGSKTIMFRPFQKEALTLQALLTNASPSLIGSLTYTGATLNGVAKDAAGIFTANKTMGYPIPPEFMPRFGRFDLPHHHDPTISDDGATATPPFLEGLNYLFRDDPDPTKPVFEIIGGEDNTSGGNLVKPMFFQTHASITYGDWVDGADPQVLNVPSYAARKTTSIGTLTANAKAITNTLNDVHSSDLGAGLRGIQLPPYLGVARIYGVYERADYVAKGGATWKANRVKLESNPAINLLKQGASKQTLFILQNGAKDLTEEDGDHTFIIPEEAIDITQIPTYSSGDDFDTFDYVVECVVFGFSKNWINENNYVLSRLHNGQGTLRDEATLPLLEEIEMVIPGPASTNDQMYILSKRTVYQGDPFMTRNGETQITSDYENRYGEIPIASAAQLATPIQQFNSNGVLQIERPNARAFEVLASVDFYTSLGTGKIGGKMYPGTPLDVAFLENTVQSATRIPDANDQTLRVLPRLFTEGQTRQTNRASARLDFLTVDNTIDELQVRILDPDGNLTVLFAQQYGDSLGEEDFAVGYVRKTLTSSVALDFGSINDGATAELTTTVTGAIVGNPVLVSSKDIPAGLIVTGFVSAADTVTVRLTNSSGGPLDPVSITYSIEVFTAPTGATGTYDVLQSTHQTAKNLADVINNHSTLPNLISAFADANSVVIQAVGVGAIGNGISIELWHTSVDVTQYIKLVTGIPQIEPPGAKRTKIYLQGGIDEPVNGGNGNSQINMIGTIEQLPLGILLQDFDFMAESPLRNDSSAMKTSAAGIQPAQTTTPFTEGGKEFTRFFGTPGEIIGMSDGKILGYTPYHATDNPAGTKRYRLYRGGGSCFMLSGKNPGGPLDWISDAIPSTLKPVLKGGVLACKALLVRNFEEKAFATDTTVSHGDEIQMVVLTHGVFGNGQTQEQGVSIKGVISPVGYGEGYAASDRYRIPGRPMYKDHSRLVSDPATAPLAALPKKEG